MTDFHYWLSTNALTWRGVGWIREVLVGPVHLPTSGLYDARTPEAGWILDDYQDNRHVRPPYGYPIADFEANGYDRGGFSIQPNLLAGLMPRLDRDEPGNFLWMFFNAWCACYRDEIDAMVEQSNPEPGYSSAAHFKSSDESNAVSWLRAMFVYANDEVLHVGRALPREWLAPGRPCGTSGVCTRYGTVGVEYHAAADRRHITATLELRLRVAPPSVLVRFRHAEGLPLRAVRIDGVPSDRFDPRRNDVDVTGRCGRVVVEAEF